MQKRGNVTQRNEYMEIKANEQAWVEGIELEPPKKGKDKSGKFSEPLAKPL